jgi:Fur family ferric uptake transcriptional regulator
MRRRNTPAKEAILNVLSKAGKAMSQDAIEEKIAIYIIRETIYRVINRFCDDGVFH